ncbi:MAG: general secretion pathway protein GspK [Nitrospirae bacterium]|nr:general secretion pathway protein GspK [Nitrospirota bacterium]
MNTIKNIKREDGIALILVLWVMVMLTAIVGEFAFSMRTEVNIARNFKEEETAYQLAIAGVEKAKAEILAANEAAYPFFNRNGVLVFSTTQLEENPERKAMLKNGIFSYTVIDEDGKININAASPEQLRHIISATEIDSADVDTIVDSILDWQDTDNLHRLNGAEEEYYQSLPIPYSCKDNKFSVIE